MLFSLSRLLFSFFSLLSLFNYFPISSSFLEPFHSISFSLFSFLFSFFLDVCSGYLSLRLTLFKHL